MSANREDLRQALVLVFIAACGTVAFPSRAASSIVLDGSIGTGPTTALNPLGTVTTGALTYQKIAIPESYGLRAGANLFHSFSTFSIGSGDAAVFTLAVPASNVISRVTGGQVSTINGLMSLDAGATGSKPNFFFINPAGVTFGAGAVIDVPAAFHVSTANYVRFPEGNFNADAALSSTFSSAAPEAFGFLGTTRSTVTIRDQGTLVTKSLQSMGIVAGDVVMDNGVAKANGGDIRVVAMGGQAGEAALAGALPAARGNTSIVNGGWIFSSSGEDASGSPFDAGSVSMATGNLAIDAGASGGITGIFSQAASGTTGGAGVVSIAASGAIEMRNRGKIDSSSFSSGNAGVIVIGADRILIDGRGQIEGTTGIFSSAIGDGSGGASGRAGSIFVNAVADIGVVNGGYVSSSSSSSGAAGSVYVHGDRVTVDGSGSGISAAAKTASTSGQTGFVTVTAASSITVSNDGVISIKNDAIAADLTVATPSTLVVAAPSIVVNGGGISASSSGNVGAGFILVNPVLGADGYWLPNADGYPISNPAGSIEVLNGGYIKSSSYGAGAAGSIYVSGSRVWVDGTDSAIGALASTDSTSGQTGYVTVTASDSVIVSHDGVISIKNDATADNPGAAVPSTLVVAAPHVVVSGGGGLSASTSGNVNAGYVMVNPLLGADGYWQPNENGFPLPNPRGSVEVLDGGYIKSSTYGAGAAGSIYVSGKQIAVDGSGSSISALATTDSTSGQTGYVTVNGAESVTVTNYGVISIRNDATVANPAGVAPTTLLVAAPRIVVGSGGGLTASTRGNINAGYVLVNPLLGADGDWVADGNGDPLPNLFGRVEVGLFGDISSDSHGAGNAGGVIVSGDDVVLDGGNVSSKAYAAGHAGIVAVNGGNVHLLNGGWISSDTRGAGNAGSVTVSGKSVNVEWGYVSSDTSSSGNAGDVTVSGDTVSLRSGGWVSSNTRGDGVAGSVTVSGKTIDIGGGYVSSDTSSSGDAGNVTVKGDAVLIHDGGWVSSDTLGGGNAGAVMVSGGQVTLDHGWISSDTYATGHAGNVLINPLLNEAGELQRDAAFEPRMDTRGAVSVRRGGEISSTTYGAGSAGEVRVGAASVVLEGSGSGISAAAKKFSSGQTGVVSVIAAEGILVRDGAKLSVENDATLESTAGLMPTLLRVEAPNISLLGGEITASSSGNVAASNVALVASKKVLLDRGQISTSANLGSGGAIRISAGDGAVVLDNSRITTSVSGTPIDGRPANGGNIDIQAKALVMNTGFIQANTNALRATGGDVHINVRTLVPSGTVLLVGGQTPYLFQPGVFGFNVIQAVAPNGVSGTPAISSPVVDITGALSDLSAPMIDAGGLGRSPCRISGGSSLVQSGRGGFAPSARDLLGPEPVSAPVRINSGATLPPTGFSRLALGWWGCAS